LSVVIPAATVLAMVARKLVRASFASALVLLLACRPDHRTRQEGPNTLRVVNATRTPLREVYLAPTKSTLWGKNWIAREIPSGAHVDLPLRPDAYVMRLGDCSGGTALVVYHFDVDDDADFVVHDDYGTPPPSRDVTQLAFPTSKHLHDAQLRHISPARPGEPSVAVTVTSRCARDLRIVVGGDPGGRTGVPSTVPARSFARYTAPVSTPLWIVDAEYRPVSSTTLRADRPKIEITPSCDAWTAG
jgi:hypothetical protein